MSDYVRTGSLYDPTGEVFELKRTGYVTQEANREKEHSFSLFFNLILGRFRRTNDTETSARRSFLYYVIESWLGCG